MREHVTEKCVGLARAYCDAKKEAQDAEEKLEEIPVSNEEGFLAALAKAFDTNVSPRDTPESVILAHAKALNLRQQAEDEDKRAKDALVAAKTAFDGKMKLLRGKV